MQTTQQITAKLNQAFGMEFTLLRSKVQHGLVSRTLHAEFISAPSLDHDPEISIAVWQNLGETDDADAWRAAARVAMPELVA